MEFIEKKKAKDTHDEFNELYEEYKKNLESFSGGLLTSDKGEFVKFYAFYNTVTYPNLMKIARAMLGEN